MIFRYPIVLFTIVLLFSYAQESDCFDLKKVNTPLKIPINVLQKDISGIKSSISNFRSQLIKINRTLSRNQKLSASQSRKINSDAFQILQKAREAEKHWQVHANKQNISRISKKDRLKIRDISLELKSVAQSMARIISIAEPEQQGTTIDYCLKLINDSPDCGSDCCNEQPCRDCCFDVKPKERIGLCTAKCTFKTALCIMSGIADRQADNTGTITSP